MSQKIQIILLEDIEGLGQAGDITSVNEGYARNFLFPEGKAALADEKTKNAAAEKVETEQKAEAEKLAALRSQAEALEGTELTLSARVKEGEGDEIFGSIKASHIVEALAEQAHLELKAKDILLEESVTRLGSQKVIVRLAPDVEAEIKVTVVPDEES